LWNWYGFCFSKAETTQESDVREINQLVNSTKEGYLAIEGELCKLTDTEIREAIQALVAQDQIDIAVAVSSAALILRPESEDILAISGLLAMCQSEWDTAVELLESLLTIQGEHAPPQTYLMLAKSLRCAFLVGSAMEMVKFGLKHHFNDPDLTSEYKELLRLNMAPESAGWVSSVGSA
jgi:uncharacterized protein HemY